MYYLKESIKKLINAAGYDLKRLTPDSNPAYQLLKGLKRFEVDLVLDIGANTGQFASELRTVGYQGKIVSFEPLSVASELLSRRASQDADWLVHRRGAIGDYDGEIEINISGNSVSSSVLPMMQSHISAAEGSGYIASEQVPICRLDSVAPAYISPTDRYFLKIDTQGFEWQVLDGASNTLALAQGLLCELSLVPLYEGQKLWLELIQRLEKTGFALWSIQKGFTDPRDGRSLQVDAIFFRDPNITVSENAS
jgi:FkbM family methyltransferase